MNLNRLQIPPEMGRPRTMEELKAGDCWSIGVIAYILIAGRPPFGGNDHEQIFSNICNKKRKVRFPKGVTVSFMSFVQSLLSHDIKQRMTVAQALQHPWICGDGASTDRLGSSYLKSLQKFNRGNKLQKIMINACIERANTHDRKVIENGLMDVNRKSPEMNDSKVVDYLLLHTKVTQRDPSVFVDEDEYNNVDEEVEQKQSGLMSFVGGIVGGFGTKPKHQMDVPSKLPKISTFNSAPHNGNDDTIPTHQPQLNPRAKSEMLPRRVEASKEEKYTRRISGQRFTAIMSKTPYDVTALMKDLADEDGMIPLDEIAQYDLRSGTESESESYKEWGAIIVNWICCHLLYLVSMVGSRSLGDSAFEL